MKCCVSLNDSCFGKKNSVDVGKKCSFDHTCTWWPQVQLLYFPIPAQGEVEEEGVAERMHEREEMAGEGVRLSAMN
jgi:hypothetical protein